MHYLNTLSEILQALNVTGYTANISEKEGYLFVNEKRLTNPTFWIHCHWFDDLTDERVTVYCCVSDEISGTFIN